ncbi:methyl-accepting chemotaxis protein [Microbacteriaceae bacterium 4G12]
MSIRKKLMASFLSIILLFSVSASFSVYCILDMKNKVKDLSDMWVPSLVELGWFNGAISNVPTTILELTAETDPEKVTQKEQELSKLLSEIKSRKENYAKNLISGPPEQKLFDSFSTNWDQFAAKIPMIIEKKKANDTAGANALIQEAFQTLDVANNSIFILIKYNTDQSQQSSALANKATDTTILWTIVIFVINVVVGLVIAWILSRRISRPIASVVTNMKEVSHGNLAVEDVNIESKDETGQLGEALNEMTANLRAIVSQVTHSSQQVAAASEELTASAEESAQAANHVSASATGVVQGTAKQNQEIDEAVSIVEQMSVNIQHIATSANDVSSTADKTASAAQNGTKVIEGAVNQIKNIEKIVGNSAQVVETLGDRSKEIGQIVDVISNIAEQTNLLALNAAIEAARAGEQGKGFAVVAGEVRKLAEQSQQSVKQITEIIYEIQNNTSKAVSVMNEGNHEVKKGTEAIHTAGETFKEIVSFINQVTTQVYEISSAIQNMASGSQQVVASIQEIEKISKDTASETKFISEAIEEQTASMDEISSSSQALAKLAEELQGVVVKFKLNN